MTTVLKNYRGKSVVLNLEKRNYSVREISEITKGFLVFNTSGRISCHADCADDNILIGVTAWNIAGTLYSLYAFI